MKKLNKRRSNLSILISFSEWHTRLRLQCLHHYKNSQELKLHMNMMEINTGITTQKCLKILYFHNQCSYHVVKIKSSAQLCAKRFPTESSCCVRNILLIYSALCDLHGLWIYKCVINFLIYLSTQSMNTRIACSHIAL